MPGAYLAENLIDAGTTITPSTEDSAYPKANLYDRQAARVFRSTSPSSLTILLDFGAAVAADTIALINHNLTQSASLKLEADNGSPPTTDIAVPTYRQHDLWKSFTSTSKRYWLLTITDSNTADIQIGQLILGVRVAFPRGRKIGNYTPATRRANLSGETYAGVFWNYHLFQRKQLNPSFRVGSSAELAILTGLDAATFGNLYPFLYIPDQAAADCYYVRKEPDFEPQEFTGRLAGPELVHDYQMILIEESRGLEVQA
jgi:hypothetical protein